MAELKRCVIVSGSPVKDDEFIQKNIQPGDYIIAADLGYKKVINAGLIPDVIVADFDSSEKPDFNIPCEVFPVEKDATDTFNALKLAIDKGFNEIHILGALGGRIDHTYSNILCLDYARIHGVFCDISDSNNRISLIEKTRTIHKEYQWFSLFAFLGNCNGVRLNGAHYTQSFFQKNSIDLFAADQFGQSNYIEGDVCEITVDKGVLLLIEANDFL